MAITKGLVPGYPAKANAPYNKIAEALPGSGPIDVPAAQVTNVDKITPNRTFSWTLQGGVLTTFYQGVSRVVSHADATAIKAKGWAT